MVTFQGAVSKIGKVISSLENSKIPLSYFILTFFSAVTLRNFMEFFSSGTSIEYEIYFHFYLFWVSVAMLIILLFSLLTRLSPIKIAKVILPAFIIVNIVPIVDLAVSRGQGYPIAYLLPEVHDNLISRYLTLGGKFTEAGITPGHKVEFMIIMLCSFIYFYIKGFGRVRSLIYSILTYTTVFCYFASPFILKLILGVFGLGYEYSEMLFVRFHATIILCAGIYLVYKEDEVIRIIVKDIRLLRAIHYELMFVLGAVIGSKAHNFALSDTNIFYFIFIPASILAAWVYSVITNNIEDYEIDKVSNKNRPLVGCKIEKDNYSRYSWLFLSVALFYAAIVNYWALFIILLFIGNYYMYSMPPLRLKRVPFFSKVFIALNSLILVMLGFIIITGSIDGFPSGLAAFFMICLTAALNFIDIKDYEGDKKAGIKTLPVILGLKKAKLVIGAFFLLAYASIYFLISARWLVLVSILALAGLVQFYFINKKDYNEKQVLVIHILSIIFLITALLAY